MEINKLTQLAIRHAEISADIKTSQSQREVNLECCHKTEDIDFENDREFGENCLSVSFKWVKEDRENCSGYDDGFAYPTDFTGFDEVIHTYGCLNCRAAYDLKVKIGKLKQERGRIHSSLTIIGKTLMHLKDE